MPEILIVENMGNKGLNTDNKPWSLPPEFITFGRNFRIFANAIQTAGGWKIWSAAPEILYPGHIMHVGATSGEYWIVCGRETSAQGSWAYSTPATFTPPTAGQMIHSDDQLSQIHVHKTDDNATDQTTNLLQLSIGDHISNQVQLWEITSITDNTTYFTFGVVPNTQEPDGTYTFQLVYTGAVWAFDGQNWTEISSAYGYSGIGQGDELLWTSCMLGQIPLINNPQAQPEYWSPVSPGQIMQPLQFDQVNTWRDLGYSAKILRSHKNFLFALNLQEGLTEFPDSFRWSHPADINGLPPTWDETDDAFLAGKAALGGDGGEITDAQSIRDAMAIYSENAIDMLDSTNDEFVWRRRELSATVGLLARNALTEVKGQHFFLADGDIVVNDGHSINSIAHNRLRRQINARISVDYYSRSYAVRNDALKEVWFCVPEEDAEYANVAYIYNWTDNTWAIRELPYQEGVGANLYKGIAYAGYGSQTDPVITWDANPDTELWNSQTNVWGSAERTPLDDTVVGCDNVNNRLVLLDPKGTPDTDIETRIERTDYPLTGQQEVTTITRVYPHISGEQELSIQFGSQDFAGAPVRWKPAVIFNPATDRKIDLRTTGELHCWRIDSVGKNNYEMSGMTIEFEKAGMR